MYKRILCPVDGSHTSDIGLQEAIKLAKDQGAQLRLVHVIDTYMPVLDMSADFNLPYMIEMLRENGARVIDKAGAVAGKSGIKADTKTIESAGSRASAHIVAEAEQWQADLIVMGTHGLRGVSRLVMGSDAENVLRTCRVPLLLVKDIHVKR